MKIVSEKDVSMSVWQANREENYRGEYDREMQRYFPNALSFEQFCEKMNARVFIAVDRIYPGMTNFKSINSVIELIKGYRSYPEFRNEDTVRALYKRIDSAGTGMKTDMPIFVKKYGRISIIAGNTRSNLAMIAEVDIIGQLIDLDV